jgi:hypothetical protein
MTAQSSPKCCVCSSGQNTIHTNLQEAVDDGTAFNVCEVFHGACLDWLGGDLGAGRVIEK